ncbi:lysophospholipid acyltransferase family protein [bacterium]|nr:lysophospholipid acyltransferase family protein [bacterium]
MVALIPHPLAKAIGRFLGARFYDWVPKERNRALQNFEQAYPDMTTAVRSGLVRDVFVNLGQNALELFEMLSYTTARIIRLVEGVEGAEHMQSALAKGKGVLCLTGHLGNWEILPVYMYHMGWPAAVVAQVLYDQRLDTLLNEFRGKHNVQVIKRSKVTSEIIRSLRRNMLLGILNDQDTGVDSRFAPFYGKPAKTPVGIFRLARKIGTPVVPVFITRQANGRHKIYIEPALDFQVSDNEEKDLQACALAGNLAIEKYVRLFPEQWVWFHRRWKSRPEGEADA